MTPRKGGNIADKGAAHAAVDEPLRATRCGHGKGCMTKGERCLTHDLWEDLGDRIEDYLASVSLADVLSGRLAAERHAA